MELWYPGARKWLGPSNKKRYGTNGVKGIVNHSAVGYSAGLHHELVRADRGAAWHFSVMQDGTVEQHYPLNSVLWHAADAFGNMNYIGIEHEGGFNPANEPLTVKQREASVKLCQWIAKQAGFSLSRVDKKTLWEHNEIADKATQCPSGRIPWQYYVDEVTTKVPRLPTIEEFGDVVASIYYYSHLNTPMKATLIPISIEGRVTRYELVITGGDFST